MTVKDLTDVCRLCLRKESLLWIFDKKYQEPENIKDIIYITTGVQITPEDNISQKICRKCWQMVTNIDQFRSLSQQTDRKLREQWQEHLQLTKMFVKPNAAVKTENVVQSKTKLTQEVVVHPSVSNIFSIYPQINLLNIDLNDNISPWVSMKFGEVESYFKQRNINMQQRVNFALKSYEKYIQKEQFLQSSKYPKSKTKRLSLSEGNKKTEIPIKTNIEQISIKNKSDNSNYTMTNEDKTASRKTTSINSSNVLKRKLSLSKTDIPEKKIAFGLALEKQVPLHMCDICNSVHYHRIDLKRHREKHLRCQFCETRFKTIDLKNEHIKYSCIIKNTMSNLPTICLKKVEFDEQARKDYPRAFINFCGKPQKSKTSTINAKKCLPDIEILSRNKNIIENSNSKCTANSSETASYTLIQENNSAAGNIIIYARNLIYSNTSIVKPDVNIKNCHLLDIINFNDSELSILKQLLMYSPKYNMLSAKTTQTNSLRPLSIRTNPDSTTVFQDLNHCLYLYDIPIDIRPGFLTQISYNCEKRTSPTTRNMFVWNNLTATDIIKPVQKPRFRPIIPKSSKEEHRNNSISNLNEDLKVTTDNTVILNSSTDSSLTVQNTFSGNIETSKPDSTLKKPRTKNNKPTEESCGTRRNKSKLFKQTTSAITKSTLNNLSTESSVHTRNPKRRNSKTNKNNSSSALSTLDTSIHYPAHTSNIALTIYQPIVPTTNNADGNSGNNISNADEDIKPTIENTLLINSNNSSVNIELLKTTSTLKNSCIQSKNLQSNSKSNKNNTFVQISLPSIESKPILNNTPALSTIHSSGDQNTPSCSFTTNISLDNIPLQLQNKNLTTLQRDDKMYLINNVNSELLAKNPLLNGFITLNTHPPSTLSTAGSSNSLQHIPLANNVSLTNPLPTLAVAPHMFVFPTIVPTMNSVPQSVGVTNTSNTTPITVTSTSNLTADKTAQLTDASVSTSTSSKTSCQNIPSELVSYQVLPL